MKIPFPSRRIDRVPDALQTPGPGVMEPPTAPWTRWELAALAAVIASVAAFYLLTLREGHSWGDDFALYIHHAKNLVEGRSYSDTGLIHNPAYPVVGQTPPVFPCLLAPVYYFFGLNLRAMKVEVVLFFVAALLVIAALFRKDLPPLYLLLMIGLIGFNPIFWMNKDLVLSDFPFLFMVYGIFLLHGKVDSTGSSGIRQTSWALALGLSLYVAAATRMVGVLFVPCLWAYDLLRNRRPSRATVLATLVFALLYGIQYAVIPIGGTYFEQSHLTPRDLWENVVFYLLRSVWSSGHRTLAYIPAVGAWTLVGIGYKQRWVQRRSIGEIYMVAYLGALMVWSFRDARYLYPVLPLYFFYFCLGLVEVQRRLGAEGRRWVPLVVAAEVVIYVAKYTTLDFGPFPAGPMKPASQDMFRFIRDHTNPQDVLVSIKPRAVSLFTDRAATIFQPAPDDEVLRHLRRVHVAYALVGPRAANSHSVLARNVESLEKLVARHPDLFELVYSNSSFHLYRCHTLGSE